MEELNEEVVESKKGLTGRSEGKPTILIPGEIESVSKRGVTVAAGTVYDYKQKKFQQDINEEVVEGLQQLTDDVNDNVKHTLSEHSSEIEEINESLEENIPYVIVYENQTVNIPCDPYGTYVGSEQEIGTVVKLYRGNIQKEIEYDASIAIDSPTDKGFTTSVEEDGSAIISIPYTDISNLDDNTDVDFYILSQGKSYYGKVIFNKVKRGKSAYEEWKDANPTIENPTIDLFLAELKNTDNIKGPKYAAARPVNPPESDYGTIYFIPIVGNPSTQYNIDLLDSNGEWHNLVTRPGDITNYAGIYDVSEDNLNSSNNPTKYPTLSDAIDDIAETAKKGGMTIKYIDSDGKYVQYRYTGTSIADIYFKNEANWVLSELPIENTSDADLEFSDNNGNVLVRYRNGHHETKYWSSDKSQQNTGERDYDVFSTSDNHAIGDIVLKDGLLYKFTSEHEAGDWDDREVEQTSIAKILEDKIPEGAFEIEDTNEADLEFCDANGNVLSRHLNGDFQTKNFNSKFYRCGIAGKKISILGDSISTFEGWIPTNGKNGYAYTSYAKYYPYGTLTSVTQTWWYKVINSLSLVLGQNCSWSGSCVKGDGTSTSSAIAGCSDRRIADLGINGIPDIIIIFMGTNDFTEANNVPIGTLTSKDAKPANGTKNTFSEAYALMLSKILQSYPLAHVFCCSLLDNKSSTRDADGEYPTQNAHGVYLEDYNAKIKELALGYGAHFIDLHNCGIHWCNLTQMTVDTGATHPNEAGHTLMANMIKKELMRYF